MRTTNPYHDSTGTLYSTLRSSLSLSRSCIQTSANTITLAEVQPFINEFYAKKSCTYRVRALL